MKNSVWKIGFLFTLPMFAGVLCASGCQSASVVEVDRAALPLHTAQESAFFARIAPEADGKIQQRCLGSVRICCWTRSGSAERVWMLWSTTEQETFRFRPRGSVFAIRSAGGGKIRLEAERTGMTSVSLSRSPIYLIGSEELELEFPPPEKKNTSSF